MASELHKTRVGIFVCIGFALVVASLLVWSHLQWGGRPRTYACYFGESVQGLTMNSPVRFRGINVGTVSHIGIAPDGELAEVLFDVDSHSDFKVDLDEMFVRIVGNLLTGIKYLEIELVGDKEKPNREFAFDTDYPVVGTYHSLSAEDIFYQVTKFLDDLNVKDISTSLTNILSGVESFFSKRSLDPLVSNINLTADNLTKITATINESLENTEFSFFVTNLYMIADNFKTISESVRNRVDDAAISNIVASTQEAAENLKSASAAVSPEDVRVFRENLLTLVNRSNTLVGTAKEDLDDLAQELMRSAANIRAFTDSLRSRPAQTLFGEVKEEEVKR